MLFWLLAQRLAVTVVLAIVSTGTIMSAVSTHPPNSSVRKPIRWLLHGPAIAAIAADAEGSRLLDNTQPFVWKGREDDAIPPNWYAIPIASFASFGVMKSALEGGRLAQGVKGVMYDNEKWRFTPQEEQQDPARYEKLAADLVHARGLLFLAAPAVGLVAVLSPESQAKRHDAYLSLGIAGDAARYADVVDIQAQSAERNTEVYTNFVSQAAAQARQANPKVTVLAGISTNPNGQQVTADEILRAIAATRDIVDGYWFNIPRPSEYCPRCNDFRPDIAIDVLRRLSAP
jgi:hypothetical protein